MDVYVKIDLGFQTELNIFNSAARQKPLSAQLINPALAWGKEKAVVYQPDAAHSSAFNVAFKCDILMCKIYDSNSAEQKKLGNTAIRDTSG